ncbi:hypothetical protein Taro_026918, partial [Colocasia esculenta]|nr:hypothetical protein [Colocasia esculenta]
MQMVMAWRLILQTI